MRLPSARDCIDKHANSALRLTTQFLLIDANIDRAERMIRDLLDTNRIRANERLPLHLAECDLAAIARGKRRRPFHLAYHNLRTVFTKRAAA
jgi:signal transduction histidine kinase